MYQISKTKIFLSVYENKIKILAFEQKNINRIQILSEIQQIFLWSYFTLN
jgi:hypothetical protein